MVGSAGASGVVANRPTLTDPETMLSCCRSTPADAHGAERQKKDLTTVHFPVGVGPRDAVRAEVKSRAADVVQGAIGPRTTDCRRVPFAMGEHDGSRRSVAGLEPIDPVHLSEGDLSCASGLGSGVPGAVRPRVTPLCSLGARGVRRCPRIRADALRVAREALGKCAGVSRCELALMRAGHRRLVVVRRGSLVTPILDALARSPSGTPGGHQSVDEAAAPPLTTGAPLPSSSSLLRPCCFCPPARSVPCSVAVPGPTAAERPPVVL